ncbi:phage baseplate assembly protein V [Chitinophagaceae bacterium 26-R-25]|nr:phage baseplate assembly protein V [Chitinophagaceae bacterium 26-R-25]
MNRNTDTARIGCSVHIDNKKIHNIQSIDITQVYGKPNKLEMRLFGDRIQDPTSKYLDGAENLMGKPAHIVLLNVNNEKDNCQEQLFVITNVRLEQKGFNGGMLLLTGHSPDYLLKSTPHYEAFADTTLKQIAENMYWPLRSISQSEMDINPSYLREISFAACFNQNYYDFLQRYAVELGEWFFFQRAKLVYGQLPSYESSKLVYGENCSRMDMSMEMQSLQSNLQDYEASSNSPLMQNAKADNGNISYHNNKAFGQASTLYRNETSALPATLDASNGAIEAMGKARSRGTAANMFTISGDSIDWTLHVGKPVELSFKIGGEEKPYTTARIIEVKHHYKAGGDYENSFKAIPATATVPPIVPYTAPQPQTVLATVIDNADAQGRVKVEFIGWNSNKGNNRYSNWMRVAAGYAGQSDKVGTHRGFVFIPEKGEQVYVSFENGNPDRPYVSGSVFHGKNGQGGQANNHIKSIITRSGCTIKFDDTDGEGSITMTDAAGSSCYLDGKGNGKIKVAKNLIMDAGEDMEVNVGRNMTFNVGNQATLNIMQQLMVNTPVMLQLITEFFHTQAGKALINSNNEIKLESPEMYVAGQQKLLLHSDEVATLNSKGTVHVKGEEGNHHSNDAAMYDRAMPEINAKCVVWFRPAAKYNGEYGFDWLRTGDTGLKGDSPFEKIMGKYYEADNDTVFQDTNDWNENFHKDTKMYERLLRSYNSLAISWKSQDGEPYLYPIPVLTLLKGKSAKLSLKVDIEEQPEKLTLEFADKNAASFLKLNTQIITAGIGKHDLADYVTIECLKEFATEQILQVKADDKICGQLRILPNDKAHQKEIKVVFVKVQTDINGSKKPLLGVPIAGGEEFFKQCLAQALVIPDLTTESKYLNVTSSFFGGVHTFRNQFCTLMPDGNYYLEDAKSNGLKAFLERELKNQFNDKYKDHYHVFFFGEKYIKQNPITLQWYTLSGVSDLNSNICAYFPEHNQATLAHELFHAMGLPHTFDGVRPQSVYTYEAKTTDNIMDYGHKAEPPIPRRSLFYWQWKALNPNIK